MAKTFKEYLYETEWYDGELIIDGLESEFSFVWYGKFRFTEKGEEKFKPILDGTFVDKDEEEGYIEVTTTGASEELINLFHATNAGFVPSSFYDEMMEEVDDEN